LEVIILIEHISLIKELLLTEEGHHLIVDTTCEDELTLDWSSIKEVLPETKVSLTITIKLLTHLSHILPYLSK
jgi:hypothetical protein